MKKAFNVLRRRFMASGVAIASNLQLQHAPRALGLTHEASVCSLAAEQEAGPYDAADEILRSNIVYGKPGVPLSLRIMALDSRSCQPLPHAAIDIWHCDAMATLARMSPRSRSVLGQSPGFQNFIVYRPETIPLEIVAVLHGTLDVKRVLEAR